MINQQYSAHFRLVVGFALAVCTTPLAWGTAKVTGITFMSTVASSPTTVDKKYLVSVSNTTPALTQAYARLTGGRQRKRI